MRTHKVLSVFSLAMINVAAILSLRNWPVGAEYGFASIFFQLMAGICFFLPVSLVSAELATSLPKEGGIFAWVKEAFGHRTGFLAIWILWIENVFWYPIILSFIAAAIAYIFQPSLANDALFTALTILVLFWGTTLVNLLGTRTYSWISTIGVILGTLIPGAIIIILGLTWGASGNPIEIDMSWGSFFPDLSNIDELGFLAGILFSFAGMEMSSVHVNDVQNPQKVYSRAIFLALIIILTASIFGVLSVALVIPQKEISLVSGALQAFDYFMNAYGIPWMTPIIAFLITVGAIGAMSTWTAGPVKGLLAAARYGDLPPFFRKINKKGMPITLLIVQAFIVSIISLLFLLAPTVSVAFWTITAIVAQTYMIMYLLMFAAALKLRYKHPHLERPYRVPGGKIGIWAISGLGIVSSIAAFLITFVPPAQLPMNTNFYIISLLVGNAIACFAPSIILHFKKPSWDLRLKHEEE